MKKQSILVLAVVVLLAAGASASTYSGGDGSVGNPYQIATAADMNEIGANPDDWDAHFVMVNDINLADYNGTQFNIIGPNSTTPFTGVFDGNGHTISNFTYESTGTDNIGLFGYVGDSNAEIKNLTLIDPNIDAGMGDYVGALLSRLENGDLTNCGMEGGYVIGNDMVGCLVGFFLRGEISDCFAAGEVYGGNYIGGLVGDNWYGTISNSYVTSSVYGNKGIGGLVGLNKYEGKILNCYAEGTVFGYEEVGGLVGVNYHLISNCYAEGSIRGYEKTGGLVGENWIGTILNCYADTLVRGKENTGGLVGANTHSTISDCFAIGAVDGNNFTGGLVGYSSGGSIYDVIISNCYAAGAIDGNDFTGGLIGGNEDADVLASFWDTDVNPDVNGIGNTSDPNVIGESTTNMQKESTFTDAGWDFVEIWNIGENQTYPYLRQYPAGDLNHDGRVDFFDFAIAASHWLKGEGYD